MKSNDHEIEDNNKQKLKKLLRKVCDSDDYVLALSNFKVKDKNIEKAIEYIEKNEWNNPDEVTCYIMRLKGIRRWENIAI